MIQTMFGGAVCAGAEAAPAAVAARNWRRFMIEPLCHRRRLSHFRDVACDIRDVAEWIDDSIERRIERTVLDLKYVVRNVFDAVRDGEPSSRMPASAVPDRAVVILMTDRLNGAERLRV